MGKRTVEIFTCDVCGREVKESEWTSFRYPTLVHHLDDWGNEKRREIAMLHIDACDSCLDKMTALETNERPNYKQEFKWREASE